MDVKLRRQYNLKSRSAKDINNATTVALIPGGEVIRNFVYTGAFDVPVGAAKPSLLTISCVGESYESNDIEKAINFR